MSLCYNLLTNSFTYLLLLAIYLVYSPKEIISSFAFQEGVVPVVDATMDAIGKSIDWLRAWSWRTFWMQSPFLLFLTFMHDDVWLPFLLSMALVLFIVLSVYLPEDTGQTRPSYVPKRHRKWARYRSKACKDLVQYIGSTSFGTWVAMQARKIEIWIQSSKTTKRYRGQRYGRNPPKHLLNRKVRWCIHYTSNTLAFRAMKKVAKNIIPSSENSCVSFDSYGSEFSRY